MRSCQIIFKEQIFSSQRLLNNVRHIFHQGKRTVPSVLRVGGGASHYKTARGEEEVKGEDDEVSVESSLDKTVPLDFQ